MSYILDALKKAESERKLGSVPNVYMEALPMAKSDEPVSAWRRSWIGGVVALLAVVGVAVGWMQKTSQEDAAPLSRSASPVIAVQAMNQVAPTSEDKASNVPGASVASQANKPTPKKTAAAHENNKEATARNAKLAVPDKASAAAAKEKMPKSAGPDNGSGHERRPATSIAGAEPEKSARAHAKLASVTPVQQADAQVVALNELPDNIKRGIPSISVGGYIFSPNPAERSMLLNNRLVREGEHVASGLVLEKMLPKEAVLNYQGQRFRVPY